LVKEDNQTFHQERQKPENGVKQIFNLTVLNETRLNSTEDHNVSYYLAVRDEIKHHSQPLILDNFTMVTSHVAKIEAEPKTNTVTFYETPKSKRKSYMLYVYLSSVVACAVAIVATFYYR